MAQITQETSPTQFVEGGAGCVIHSVRPGVQVKAGPVGAFFGRSGNFVRASDRLKAKATGGVVVVEAFAVPARVVNGVSVPHESPYIRKLIYQERS